MADEEAEQDHSTEIGSAAAIGALRERLQELATELTESREPALNSASQYCQKFCQTLVEYAGRWKISEGPLPLVQVYMVAILSYAEARHQLSSECDNVSLVLERLALSCVELLLALPEETPNNLWKEFQTSVQTAHNLLLEDGNSELQMLCAVAQESGVWTNSALQCILSKEAPQEETVNEFLRLEGPVLLEMRIKHLIKEKHIEKAASLAKACSDHLEFRAKSSFKQTYLVCLTAIAQQEQLMQEISEVDCKEALEMICNLESDGDEKAALSLCTAFLTRQLLQGDMYCAWELTLFWSKLQQRTEPSTQVFLDHCRQLSQLSKTVYHIFFLIKVIQSEVEDVGLAVCIELCIQALRMESSENPSIKGTICKTISCLLPDDLEVKRACQLTEFLLEPTVESYYAVETLYNEPDQKFEVDNLPVPNSLRCELLLVFKTQWPFDPEFWDWKTLKRHCLELMGEEASIVSSIDELNDSEAFEQLEDDNGGKVQVEEFGGLADCLYDTPNVLNEMADEKQKKREIKKLREKGFISARFRNWQAYMQYCVLCDKEFLGHRIVRHAQKHVKDGVYSCPICGENFDQKELFVPHVTSHVKQSCKERLAAMKQSRTLGKPTKLPNSNTALQKVKAADKPDNRPKKKNSPHSHDIVVFNDKDASEGDGKGQCSKPDLSVHRVEYREEYTCPVTNCRKGFKYFKNLIAHVRGHKNSEEAKRFLEMQSKKVVCQYCRRQFVSVAHLNDHLQMHCGVKPYICIQLHCKSSFLTNPELLVHRKEHVVFKAKCMFPDCGRIFYEAYMLYDHEAQHYNTFTCKFPACGKIFHSQSKLGLHQEDHIAQQKTPCNEDKAAIQDSNLTELPDTISDPSHTPLLEPNLVKLIDPNQIKLELPDPNPTQFKLELPDPSQSQLPHSNQITLPDPTQIQSELEIPCPNLTPLQDPTPVMNNCPQAVQINVEQEGKVAVINCKDSIHVCGSSQNSLPVMGVSSDVCVPASYEHLEPQPVQQPPLQRNGLPAELKESQLPDMLTGPLEEKPTELLHVKIEAPSNEEIMPEQPPKPTGDVVPNCNALSVRMPDGNNILSPSVHPQAATEKQVNVASQAKVVERFSCTFETCTRNYSSPKSVNKHMKAVHPEYHAALKLARKSKSLRKNNRKSALQSQTQEDKTQGMKTQTPLLPYQTGNVAATVSTPAFSSHSGTLTTQVFPTQIENVVNPILLSQMAEVSNQMLPLQKERGANPLLSLRMGSGLNLSHLSHKGHSAELPIHLQALASQVASSQITAANLVLSPQRPRGNTNNLVVNSQANVINPALTSQAVMFSEMQSSANLILSSQAESNCLPVLPSRLENSTDPILTPRLTDGTNSVVSHHIDSNAHSVHPAQVQRSADSLLPLQIDCGSHIGAPPTQGGSSHMAYSTMGSNNNLHVTSQVDSVTNIVLSQVDPSNPNLPSNMEGLSNALLPSLMERATHPLLPSDLESFKNAGQLETAVNPLFLPQVDARSLPDFSSQAERVANPQVENVMKSVFTSQPESAQTATAIKPLCGSPPKLEVKRTSKRTKWPAIVRDGKFICSRCYREFASPKSLGGHLSKRSHCKPFDETETSAALQQDVSSSFITNQINSSSVLNVQQQQLSANLNPTVSFKDRADQSLAIGNHPAEFLPSAIFPQVNGAVCNPNEGEQNSEVIKQALETAGLPNLFETPEILQQAFQNPCGPYQTSAHMPESTVIQHTGKAIKMELEDAEIPLIHETRNELTACAANHFVKAEEPEFCADIFSDSVLSQMLAEHNSQISLNNLGAAPLDQIITGSQSMKVEGNGEPQINANDTLLAAMANLTQHFMVNQVLQIPAADPQHLVTNRCNPQDSAPKIKNVKKKLRAQLLEKPNDLSQKSSGPAQDISLQGNGHLQKIPSNFPQTSEAMHGSAFSKIQGMTGSDNRGDTNGLPSDTTQTEKLNSELNASLSGQTLSNAPDTALSNSCDSQKEDEKIMEILTALQRLNLEKENTTDDSPAVNSCSVTSMLNCNAVVLNERPEAQHPDSTVTNKVPPLESPSKPFVCENESCPYSAMTKDALYKHYYKVHNYTEDMMNEIRQIQLKFAPFRCHICNKTFTRNSNLKAHFQTVHRLTQNKMVQLKIKRPYSKKSRPEKTATNKRPCMADGQQQEFGPEPAESTLALEKLKPTEGNSEQGMHPAVKESFKVTPTQVSCSLQDAPNGQTLENVSNSVLEQPRSGQPTVGLSAAQQPSAEYPTVDLPLAEQPAAQPPTVGQSVAGQPPVGLPVTTQSVAEPPVTTQSVAEPPVTTQSVAEPPVTTQSLAGPPVTTQSLAGPPVTTQSLAGPPVTTRSLAEPPVTTQSLAGPPVTTQSLAGPPVMTQSLAGPPVMTQSLAGPPVTTRSLAGPPVTTRSLAEPPVTTQSLAEPPVTTQSLAEPPVTTQSVAEPSVMTQSPAGPPVTTRSPAGPPVTTRSPAGPPVTTRSPAGPPPVTTRSPAGPPVTTRSPAGPPVTTRSPAEPPVTTQSVAEPPVMTPSPAEPPVMTRSPPGPPIVEQPTVGLPMMGLPIAGQPLMELPVSGDTGTGFPLPGPPLLGEPATEKVKKPKGPKPKVPKPKVEKLKVEKPKKQPKPEIKKQKKPAANTSESSHSYSPYRPYRCVHQGCFAAFTIQQNLILHYRAVHQSDLPKFEQDNEEESAEIKEELVEEINQITEFRCQVKDCSRIFQEVPSLLQHYTQLHEFSLEKAGRLLSDMNLGRFRCDQPECKASFTAFWKYIGHLEVDHEPEKLFNNDGEEGVFRCDCEGCDCVYATRSNLLRHLFRKHRDSHKSHLIRHRQKMDRQESYSVNGDTSKKSKSAGGKGDNEKENWQNNKKSKISSAERKKKKNDANKTVWIKSEKTPSLKTNDEALAMCTKKFSLQYPCMIKGCLSVVSSERNIFRHYKTHRLTDAFLLQQGSDFIICKQRSRPLKKSKSTGDDGEKSQEDQSENSEEDLADAYPELHETESLRLTSEKDKVAEYTKPFKKKRSANECSEPKLVWRRKRTIRQAFPDSVPLIKRKRGRPPLKRKRKEAVQIRIKNRRVRKLKPELCNPSNLCSGSESATSSCTVPVQKEQQHNNIDLSTFKPMGFEVSFLKFLEESADQTKRKAKENPLSEIASKRKKYFPPKCGSLDCSESDLHIRTSGYHNLIDFQNPLNLQSVKNVKIILDRTFSEGAELLLKQLQEMRPTVVLEKW
ncbi:zinc finger protein 292-like [Acipenser ruthenus]|uniref:zinc finger protein 292-like n=1 Tax=Acipenser ruthenus TaxID=7906 RepID=UPI0027410CA9|nr:zinc finger protein 292-like [Acipenser ruthenus]